MSPQKADSNIEIRTGNYERTSALLTSLVVLLGSIVLIGSMIWLLAKVIDHQRVESFAIGNSNTEQDQDHLTEVSDSVETPGVKDFPESDIPEIEKTLELTDQLSTRLSIALDALAERTTGGDPRKGPGHTPPRPVIPREAIQRWVIEYSAKDFDAYRQQLVFFEIEIGVVSKKAQRIDVIKDLAEQQIGSYTTTRRAEDRFYLTHADKAFLRWDEQLAKAAGIAELDDRFLVQFYSDKLKGQLQELEERFAEARNRKLSSVSRTVFKIRGEQGKYEFYVAEMK